MSGTSRGSLTRREWLATAGVATGAGLSVSAAGKVAAQEDHGKSERPFLYCLNTSTIRGQELGIVREVEIAAEAGYDSVEPWIRGLEDYEKQKQSLADLGKRIADLGMTVESAIGFAQWIVDDDEKRAQGLEQAKRDMDRLRQIGGKRLAAPPTGATKQSDLDLDAAAQRYRQLLQLGEEMNVVPQLEVWGFSQSLSRLGESVYVAIESGHPQACLLPDVYHLYKGGSDFAGLQLLSADAVQVFHMNDYPAEPPRESIGDKDRVYPGDGVAPLDEILQTLHSHGGQCVLSLELFNRDYWTQDPLQVASMGLEKMKAAVHKAIG